MSDERNKSDVKRFYNYLADELKKEEFAGLDSYFQDTKINQSA